jgi:hypothetical protein
MAKGLDKVLLYYEDLIYCFEERIKYLVIKDLKLLLLSKQHCYSYISHFGRNVANKLIFILVGRKPIVIITPYFATEVKKGGVSGLIVRKIVKTV